MAKAGISKNKGKKKKAVGTSWDSVKDKTVSYGKKGEENRKNARNKAKKALKPVDNRTETKPKSSTTQKTFNGGSRSGAFTPTQKSTEKRTGAKTARTTTAGSVKSDISSLKSTVNPRTVSSKVTTDYTDKTNGFNQQGKYDPKKHSSAVNAYNKFKTVEGNYKKSTQKTVQVDSAQETREKASATYKSSVKSETNRLGQVYDGVSKKLGDEYDKLVAEYGEDTVKAKLGKKKDYVNGVLGSKDDYVSSSLKEEDKELHKSAVNSAKKSGKYTYSKALESSGDAEIQRVASLFQNNNVRTKTDQDQYVTDKDGNIKYDVNIDDDGNISVTPKKKKGKAKVETTQGANIIDYYKGGFNDEGELASQKGSQTLANKRAGWIHDSPFMAGALQGSGFADIKRGLGQYSEAAGKDVDKTMSSGAAMAGYMAGFAGQFGMMGVGGMTDALVGGIGRTGAVRSATNIGLRKGATSAVVESPVNVLDAIKMSTDANGNFNKEEFKKFLLINSGLSFGMGGLIGGVGAKMTQAEAKTFLNLSAKMATGAKLTDEEIARFGKVQQKFENIRNGRNVASEDIVNKAEFDAEVNRDIIAKGGTSDDAINAINGKGTHAEKMSYAQTMKERAEAQFDAKRIERENKLLEAESASPEEAIQLRKEAADIKRELDRLGGIVNIADRELSIAKVRNRKALQNLTDSMKKVSENTGINYRILNDSDMRGIITKEMEKQAQKIERELDTLSGEERIKAEQRIEELRKGASDDYFYKGFYYKNEKGETELLINAESPQAHQTVIGHETGHLIKSSNPQEFYRLGKRLKEYAEKKGEFQTIFDKIKRSYPEATDKELYEEVYCELLGKYVYGADDAFIKRMAGENPSLFQRIVNYLKQLFDKTTDKEMAKELQSIIDKTAGLVKDIDSTKARRYNNATEVNANELGNRGVGKNVEATASGRGDTKLDFRESANGREKTQSDQLATRNEGSNARTDISESNGVEREIDSAKYAREKKPTEVGSFIDDEDYAKYLDEDEIAEIEKNAREHKKDVISKAEKFNYATATRDDVNALKERLEDISGELYVTNHLNKQPVSKETETFLLDKARNINDSIDPEYEIKAQKITYDDGMTADEWQRAYNDAYDADVELAGGVPEITDYEAYERFRKKVSRTNRDKVDAKKHTAFESPNSVDSLTYEEAEELVYAIQGAIEKKEAEILEREFAERAEQEYKDSLNKSLIKTSDYDIDVPEKSARYNDERIDRVIKRYKDGDNSTAYVTLINPKDFVDLTLDRAERLEFDISLGRWDYDEALRRSTETPYLLVDFETGRIYGHEGRHRFATLAKHDIESVPVILESVNPKHQSQIVTNPLEKIELTGQEYKGRAANGMRVEVNDLVPATVKYRDEIKSKFGGEAKIKFSKEHNAHRDELLSDAEESYGAKYTDDFNETGFIFPDGKLPKMGDYGQRAEDHNVVISLYDDIGYDTHQAPKSAAMGRFLDEGNIRIMPENGSIEMSAKVQPTSEQYSTIRRFLNEHDEAGIEFSGVDGRSVDSKSYSNGVNADQVINDIKRFYSEGKIGGSDLNNYRFSKEVNAKSVVDDSGKVTKEANDAYMTAAKAGDEATARQYVRALAEAKGGLPAYHGTNARFTVFDPAKLGSKNWNAPSAQMGFFAGKSRQTAEAYTGLDSATAMGRMSFSEEGKADAKAIREKYDADAVDDKFFKDREKFFDKYKKENGYKEEVDDRLKEVEDNGLFRNATDPDTLRENIHRTLEIMWNEEHLNDMYSAFEKTETAVKKREFDAKIYEEWEQKQIERLGYDPHGMELYAFMEKPFIYDFKGEGRDVESFAARMAKAKAQGHDGCMFLNVADGGELDDIYTVFKNTQFKSADAITYRDNGDIIPLSERFDFGKEDIRFSKEAKPEKPQTVANVIDDLTKDSRFVGDKKAFVDEVKELADLMRKDGLSNDVVDRADEIISKYMKIEEYEQWGEGVDPNVKSLIKSSAINISELGDGTIAHKLENIGMSKADVPYWVQLRSKKGGRSLDSVYHELSDERPDLFPPYASHEDKLRNIIEASKQEPSYDRKPQEWIDGEKQDLMDELITKVADADYAERKALEPKPQVKETPKVEALNPEVEKQIKQLEKERDSLISRWEDTRYTKPDRKTQNIIDSYNAEIERLKNGGNIKETPATDTTTPKAEKPKSKKPAKPKEPEKTEVQKLHENNFASEEVKTALKDIEEAGVYTEKAEKVAKRFNDLDKKIGAKIKHIENAKKSEKYATEAERSARVAELEDELVTLQSRQAKAAGELEQMGKMKVVDDTKSAGEQIKELRGDVRVNKELKNTDNLTKTDNWIKDKWTSFRRLGEDSLIDVENAAKASGDMELRGQILTSANRVRNSMATGNTWITKHRKSFDNKVGGKSLDEIFTKDLIENEPKYADYQEYLIMKHVPARHAKGTDIYPEISPALAEKRVAELEAQYDKKVKVGDKEMTEIEAWAQDVYDYIADLQKYRVDSGMLSKEAAEQFEKDYPFYVPTNRVNDEQVDFFTGGSSNGIRTAKGGENDVLDMYSQLYTATNKTIHAAEENNMLNLYFKAKGVTAEQLKDATLDDLEHAVIEAKVNKKTGASSVSFFVDGKPVRLPCNHQLALGLREMDGLEFERLLKAAKVATLYGKPFKALVTDWNLVFGVRNGARDLQQALVNSKDTRFFGSSMGAAAHSIVHQDAPYRKLYASMGGERAQLVSYDAVAKQMGIEKQGKVDAIHEKVQEFVDLQAKGKHVNPIHYIEGINGAIEMMPRLCEFIGTLRKEADIMLKKNGSSLKQLRKDIVKECQDLEKAGKIGQSEISAEVENRLAQRVIDMVGKDTIDTAMRNANDITLNFGRSGVIGKALNMGFVPYLNPSIQGLSKLVRLFTEAGQEGGWKALASLGMKLGTFTITPAVINEVLLKDNEDYQNLNTRDKDNNFFIPLEKFGEEWAGKFLKFPKPRENAVLAEPVEYGLRYFLNDSEYAFFDWDKLKMEDVPLWKKIPLTEEGKQSIRTAIDNIGVINPLTSNMASPIYQTFHNKTWYGGNIESAYESSINENTGKPNVPVNKRYDTGTSGIAIQLGQTRVAKELNLSPKKIDNILDSYTGMIYDLGITQTTEEAKTRGNWLTRTIASQFVKDSVFSNKLSTKAWDKMDGMTKKEQDAYKSKYMYDTFKYDDAMDLITGDKNLTNKQKMEAKRALQIKKNKLNREAIDGKPNTSNPLADISEYLGANKTLNHFLPEQKDKDGNPSKDDWESYYKKYKKEKGFKELTPAQKEKQAKKFLDTYSLAVKGQSKVKGDYHDAPSWGMTGVAAAQLAKQGKLKEKDATTIMQSCGVYESQSESYFNYVNNGGNVSRYAVTKKNNDKAEDLAESLGVTTKGDGSIWKNKYSSEKGIRGGVYAMSLATGKADFKDRAYYISSPNDANMLVKMNAGRGYAEKYGHTTEQLIKLGKKADKDGNTYLSNEEIESACMTIRKGKATSEERAMAWVLLGGNPNKNPFGAIGDYSHDGDTGIQMDGDESGHGGRGRRGRRHHGGGGGGSSKGTMPKTDTGAFKGKITDPFSSSKTTKASRLDDAYRKKVRKLRKELNKR